MSTGTAKPQHASPNRTIPITALPATPCTNPREQDLLSIALPCLPCLPSLPCTAAPSLAMSCLHYLAKICRSDHDQACLTAPRLALRRRS
jgi:hypothetical protein